MLELQHGPEREKQADSIDGQKGGKGGLEQA